MAKGPSLNIRLELDTRAGVEQAARDDRRSLNGMIEKICADWLAERGYLPAPAKPGPVGRLPTPKRGTLAAEAAA